MEFSNSLGAVLGGEPKSDSWTSKVAQWVKTTTAKPYELSLIPRTYWRDMILQAVLTSIHTIVQVTPHHTP